MRASFEAIEMLRDVKLCSKLTPIELTPREWTGSGCGFDRLPGVLLFEPGGLRYPSAEWSRLLAIAARSAASASLASIRRLTGC